MKTEITPAEKVKIMDACVGIAKKIYNVPGQPFDFSTSRNQVPAAVPTEPTILETAKTIFDWVTE